MRQYIDDDHRKDEPHFIRLLILQPAQYLERVWRHFDKSRGLYLERTKEMEFNYVDYYRKAYEYTDSCKEKEESLYDWRNAEALRDFYTGSVTEIKHLIQLDRTPCDLKEPKWELYKISISFSFLCEYERTSIKEFFVMNSRNSLLKNLQNQ